MVGSPVEGQTLHCAQSGVRGPSSGDQMVQHGETSRWRAYRRLPSRGPTVDLNEVLWLLIFRGLLRDHHHRLDVLGQG